MPSLDLVNRATEMAHETADALGLSGEVRVRFVVLDRNNMLRLAAEALDKQRAFCRGMEARYSREYGGYPEASAHNSAAEMAYEAAGDNADEVIAALRAAADGGPDAD